MDKISRRRLVKGLVAGAIVLGFDPTARSWVTEAKAGTFTGLPPLDGVLSTDPGTLAAAADDYGHMVHRTPVAVLFPGSVNDVVKMVKFAGAHGIRVSGRGKGHTTMGQSQADAGVVIDMSTLDTIHAIGWDRAVVDAGVIWRDLLLATTEQGLTPPVLTDFIGLTVAGTLSVGGVNGTSYAHGAQVDNVIELQVVTGEGDLVRCSSSERADLFNAALAGLGLCAIIVQATLRLIPAEDNARLFRLFYPDVPSMLHDIRRLVARQRAAGGCGGGLRLDHIRGNASPGPSGWSYYIEATSFFSDPENPTASGLLSGLSYIPGSLQIEDRTYFDFCDIVYQLIQTLKQVGLDGFPHPWLDLFVPDHAIDSFAPQAIASIDPTTAIPGTIVLFFPFVADKLNRPLLRVPEGDTFFLFDVLLTVPPVQQAVDAALSFNRAMYDQNVAQGGTSYVISAVQLSPQDWKKHFQPEWGHLVSAKRRYDPSNVLGPGPGVFP